MNILHINQVSNVWKTKPMYLYMHEWYAALMLEVWQLGWAFANTEVGRLILITPYIMMVYLKGYK